MAVTLQRGNEITESEPEFTQFNNFPNALYSALWLILEILIQTGGHKHPPYLSFIDMPLSA
jgi:hypothetical protein